MTHHMHAVTHRLFLCPVCGHMRLVLSWSPFRWLALIAGDQSAAHSGFVAEQKG